MARLNIPDEPTSQTYTVTTAQAVFPFTFAVFAKADLTVFVDGQEQLQSAFTLSGPITESGGYQGGTVTLNTAAEDCLVVIERNITPARASQFAPANTTPVSSIDQAFNRLTAVQQDVRRRLLAVEAAPSEAFAEVSDATFSGRNVVIASRPVPLTLAERFGWDINVMDFIPRSLHAAIYAGTSTADVTAYAQLAYDFAKLLGRGRVRWPAGNYRVNDTIVLAGSYIASRGDGIGTRIDCWSTTADGFHARPDGAGELFGITFDDMTIYRWGDSTAGAAIRLTKCNTFVIGANMSVLGHFGGIDVEGSRVGIILCNAQSDQHFPVLRTDSYLLRFRQKSGDSVLPAEIFCVGNNLRGNTDNKRLDHGVLVNACDGIWLTSGHYGFCYSGGITLKPETTTSNVTAVNVSAAYLDQVTGCGLRVEEPVGYIGTFGAHQIDIAQIHDCNSAGVYWSCKTSDPCAITIGQALKLNNHAVQISKGDNLDVNLKGAYDINRSGGTGTGILVQGSGKGYNLYAGVKKIDPAYTPYAGIRIEGTVSDVLASGQFTDCTYDILVSSTGTNIKFGAVSTNRSPNRTVPLSGALDIGYGQDVIVVTAFAAGMGAMNGNVDGREVTLFFTATGTVFDVPANGLDLKGNLSAVSGSVLKLISRGGVWYETGRSA